jgi:VCBS repeat-containing protein
VGGGICNQGTLTVTDSTISGNTTGGSSGTWMIRGGGGISNQRGCIATIMDTTISGNYAKACGTGVYNNGSLTVTEVNNDSASVGSQIALASGALLTVNADGTFPMTPTGSFESLGASATATDSFTYAISDGRGREVRGKTDGPG